MGSVATMRRPYRAVMDEKWDEVKSFYRRHAERLNSPLTVNGDTALHIAVYIGNMDLLKDLINIINEGKSMESLPPFDPDDGQYKPFQVKDNHGQTALHLAAAAGNIDALKLLLDCDEELLTVTNERGETPLFLAASFGQTKMVRYLFSIIKDDKKAHVKRNDKTTMLHVAILGEYFDTAVELLKWHDVFPDAVDGIGTTGFQLLANMPSAFKSGYRMGKFKTLLYNCLPMVDYAEIYDKGSDRKSQATASRNKRDLETGNERENRQPSNQQAAPNCPSGISRVYNTFWRCIATVFPTIKKVWKDKKKHNKAVELAQTLAETDFTWKHGNYGGAPTDNTSTLSDGDVPENLGNLGEIPSKSPYETPFIAAGRKGILEIVKAILDVYPQAVEHENIQNENIFHVIAKHQRENILDYLLSSSNVPISRLRIKINNENGDSILHNAAYFSASSSRDRPGEALLMQFDLQWFERIEKIVPKYFINHRNKEKLTARELFTKEHKQLLEDGQEWLRRTAEACTLVAVLIATVAFTCAYTVPGGFADTGHPLLLKETPFSVFTTSDALSLCFSLTSVVVFLSIMTSKMNEQDFRRSLPLKLVLGLTTLFLSVAFMMVAFSATLLLMVSQKLHWAAIPIYTVACCPVTIFLLLQLPLYLNISWFTLKDFVHSK